MKTSGTEMSGIIPSGSGAAFILNRNFVLTRTVYSFKVKIFKLIINDAIALSCMYFFK